MTIHIIVAVRDSAMDAYMKPFFAPTPAAAQRSFRDEVNRAAQDNPMYQHPEDYELWHLGLFNERNGDFTLTPEGKYLIARAKDLAEATKGSN